MVVKKDAGSATLLRPSAPATTAMKDVLVSGYRRTDGKVLLIVGNLSKEDPTGGGDTQRQAAGRRGHGDNLAGAAARHCGPGARGAKRAEARLLHAVGRGGRVGRGREGWRWRPRAHGPRPYGRGGRQAVHAVRRRPSPSHTGPQGTTVAKRFPKNQSRRCPDVCVFTPSCAGQSSTMC